MQAYISHCNRLRQRRQKIDHDHETHGETTESTKLLQENEFPKIMHRRVNPAPTLRKQHLPVIRSNSIRMSVPNELCLETGEMLEEERGQVTIFTEMQQILHMQGIDAILRVVLDELVRDEQGLVCIGGSQAIEGETTRQTGDGTEKTLECFSHVMRDKVFVHLREKGSWIHEKKKRKKDKLTCIIVIKDCFAFANSVSPQAPKSFLSWIIL